MRHGRSRANETKIVEGGESPLTEEGKKQAAIVANRFKSIPIEVVLSSHYLRAQETAKIIAEANGVPFEVLDMAYENEISEGINGLHEEDPAVKAAIEKRDQNWITGVSDESIESFDSILNRVKSLATLLEERDAQHIAIVSHGFFMGLFVAFHILGKYLTAENFLLSVKSTMRSTNTGITYFTIENGKWVLRSWNDSAHLGELHV